MKETSYEGPFAKAWLLDLSSVPRNADTSDIASWLLFAPQAHPLWSYHLMGAIHLRDNPGQSRPPHKDFPEASHEIMVVAVNPDTTFKTPEEFVELMVRGENWMLMPPDVTAQFTGATDSQVELLLSLLARGVSDGLLVPDSDYRTAWKASIEATLEHIVKGGHFNGRQN